MSLKKRLLSAGILIGILGMVLANGYMASKNNTEIDPVIASAKDTLYFWYTDDALTDYLSSAALEYYEATDVRIVPVKKTGLEYMQSLYDASMSGEEMPDLYMISNDALERAYLAGLASDITHQEILFGEAYPGAARFAVTYHDKMVAYPFYFETSALLYNKSYMQEVARTIVEQESDLLAAGEAQELLDDAVTAEEAEAAMQEMEQSALSEEEWINKAEQKMGEVIPATIDDILTFADGYDAPEQVEAVFKWDVSDIFYNYFVVGNYMNVGGSAGDLRDTLDIDNQQVRDCLGIYQNLNQFFSIDPKEVNYDTILQEFMDGKIVFTVATTDAVARIEEARQEGNFEFEYGVAKLPALNDTLLTKSLSVTNAVVINGFSEKKKDANDFAVFLTDQYTGGLYARTGKIPVKKGIDYPYEGLQAYMEEYENSIPMPKMMEAGNFWVKLEICFSKIWTGADIAEQVQSLAEDMARQVAGTSS